MFKKISAVSLLIGVITLVLTNAASAHVSVEPAEVTTASFQTFTVGAPNERNLPFTSLKLLIPENLRHVSVNTKPGYSVTIEHQGEGDDAPVKSVTWSGTVPAGYREDYIFSAQVPESETEIQWKAYQTYQDGTTVAWDLSEAELPKKDDGSPDFSKSGPFSITEVVAETAAETSMKNVEQAAADAKSAASRSLYVGILGIVLALAGIYLATRKDAKKIEK